MAGGRGGSAAASVAPRARLVIVRFACRPCFLGDQRLAIGDGDLIVIGMDFAERQETVPVAAVIDEGRLKRRLDPHHLRKINVSPQGFALGGFKIEFFDALPANDDDTRLLGMGGIDEHLVGH